MDNLMLRRRLMMAAQGVWTTVTATTPFSVQNALKSKVKSLIQYGKMVQDGTPTPDAPVYPVINNGTVQMVDDELPAGYKRLLGITFDGNFHYRTGEYLTSDDVVTMTLDNLSTSGKNVFGSYNGANGKNFSLYIYGSSTSGSYFRFGDQLKRPKYGGTGRRTITFGAGGTSGFAEDVSIDPDEFTTPANTYIGMLPNSSSAAYTGDIVGSILVGTRLEWIPCESDGGVIGYYERVKGNFIAPTGSGTPVSLGYDNSHLVPRVVGDTEVLTVSGKNLLKLPTFDELTSAGQVVNYWNVPIKLQPNTTYYLSTHYLNGYTSVGKTIYVLLTTDPAANSTYKRIAHKTAGISNGEIVTGDSGYLYLRVNGGVARADYEEMLENAETQLELGTEATAYEPYKEPQTASVVDLYAVGDYRDEVDLVSGPVTRRVGRKVLDGTEAGWVATSTANLFRLPDGASGRVLANDYAVICTRFRGVSAGTSGVSMQINDLRFGYSAGANAYDIYIKADVSTVDDLKALLAALPTIIWFPLATPTTESVTPQALRTVKGVNVIHAATPVAPVSITMTYRAKRAA